MEAPSILTRLHEKITGKSGNTLAQLEADQAKLAASLAKIEADRANLTGQLQASRDEADQAIIDTAHEALAAALAVADREKERLAIAHEKNRKALRAEKEKQLAAMLADIDMGHARQATMAQEMATMEARARTIWASAKEEQDRSGHRKEALAALRAQVVEMGGVEGPSPVIPDEWTFLAKAAEAIKAMPREAIPGLPGMSALRYITDRLQACKVF